MAHSLLPPPAVSVETIKEHLSRLYLRRSAVDQLIRSLQSYQQTMPVAVMSVSDRRSRRAAD
jgi:hypothetical protein